MSNPAAIPVVVVSASTQPVDMLRAVLRHCGLTTELTAVATLAQLPAALQRCQPELLLCIEAATGQIAEAATLRNAHDPYLALLSVRQSLTEEQIAQDMAQGARDAASLASPARLQSVVARELRTWRLDQALKDTLTLGSQGHQGLPPASAVAHGDAVAVVQDGMLVRVNESWQALLGVVGANPHLGLPILDAFDEASHGDLKTALIACNKGETVTAVTVAALRSDGTSESITVWPRLAHHGGTRCIELCVPVAGAAPALAATVQPEATDGLLTRSAWLDAVDQRLQTDLQGGARHVVCLRVDGFADIERKLGARGSQQVLDVVSQLTQSIVMPQDLLGRYASTGLCVLLERGTERDARAWVQRLQARLALQEAPWADASIQPTLSAGLLTLPAAAQDADAVLLEALDALRAARAAGTNQVMLAESTHGNTRAASHDEAWIPVIRAALSADRFRLVQMPVASLSVVDTGMYDILLRMQDESGRDVSPTEFLPAAQRNGLMRHIDRWVLGAALKLAARRNPACLFLRLSTQSALDPTLMMWLDAQLRVSHVPPQRLCIQVPEETAVAHQDQIALLASALRSRRMRFALEHFGIGPAPLKLLDTLPLDFIKIDGALMQGLVEDAAQRQRVRAIASAASARGIAAIAERIEDANTMAALWDLGVDLLQGHLIGMHEEVVLASA